MSGRYLISDTERRHLVDARQTGPPWQALCGRHLGAATLHEETADRAGACKMCKKLRWEREQWTTPR